MQTPTVYLIGERNSIKLSHQAIEESIQLYQNKMDSALTYRWIPTSLLSADTLQDILAPATAIWCTPGGFYTSNTGARLAVRYARENHRPFLGTCGGFQHALMEYCENVLGRPAHHQELDSTIPDPLISRLAHLQAGIQAPIHTAAGSWLAQVLGATTSTEEFTCQYGLNPIFEPMVTGPGLEFIARDEANQVRAFRLQDHPFFVGTLFQPERRAFTGALHPLVQAFLARA